MKGIRLFSRFYVRLAAVTLRVCNASRGFRLSHLKIVNTFKSYLAALGWPVATAACASSTATTDFVLSPGVILPQQQQGQRRTRRDQQQHLSRQPLPLRLHNNAGGTTGETTQEVAEMEVANKITYF